MSTHSPVLSMRNRRRVADAGTYLVGALYLTLALLPLYFMITSAFKFPIDTFARPPQFLIRRWTLTNFLDLFEMIPFLSMMVNSLIITVATTLLTLLLGLPAAYALARFQFKGREALAFFILAMRMAPGIAIVLPVYLLYQQVGLVNTLSGLVLLYTTFNLPFITWLLRTFVASIPVEIEESAMCDGCSRAAAFWRVTLPLMAPGVAVSSVFAFMLAWNEFLFAYILSGRSTRTITVAMSLFQSEEGIYWGQMMAAATLVAVPILIFALSVQKYMLSGLTLGAVKS